MDTDEYQRLAKRTQCPQSVVIERLRADNDRLIPVLHAVIGMMGELGEMAACLEKALWYGQPFDLVNFLEELGDTEWYAAEAANALCVRLIDILQFNIDKLKIRFPEKYADELAAEVNRDRSAERNALEAFHKATELAEQTGQGWAEPTEEDCDLCGGEGEVDSGGVTPWGEPILVSCVCVGPPPKKEIRGRHPLDNSYIAYCKVCGRNRVHKTNTSGVCADCHTQ